MAFVRFENSEPLKGAAEQIGHLRRTIIRLAVIAALIFIGVLIYNNEATRRCDEKAPSHTTGTIIKQCVEDSAPGFLGR